MKKFIFKSYEFDKAESVARFSYGFDDGRVFNETVKFESTEDYDEKVLDRAMFLAFVILGVSYYKTFPSVSVELNMPIDEWQASFFDRVYQEGLGQFAFENHLTRDMLAHFVADKQTSNGGYPYAGSGILALQSGGKDSLLTATLLKDKNIDFESMFLASGDHHPKVLDHIGSDLVIDLRLIDHVGLQGALKDGAKNGHVPVTYIVQSLAVVQAILLGKNKVLTSIAHEGEEPHAHIGDLLITHQWSKRYASEIAFSEYVEKYISPDIQIGSPLRCYSELRVAELFIKHSWAEYGHEFSSCNVANYRQHSDNSELKWCGDCPKCANSYLLFSAFLPASELKSLFNGQDLFDKPSLQHTFKGLLGIDNIIKPFECVGEIEELRLAYQLSQQRADYQPLSFEVPASTFDYTQRYPSQGWATEMLQ